MQLEPKDLYEKVEFEKVIELLQKECLGELGKNAIQNLPIMTVRKKIHQQLLEGLDFASAAISYSGSQEALEGGLVGWRDLNSVPVAFSEAIKNLRAGDSPSPALCHVRLGAGAGENT